jgi:hypothetical protein
MPRAISPTSTYMDKLVKLIPAEWVSAYVAIKGILDSTPSDVRIMYWAIIVVLLILLPLYLRRVLRVASKMQIFVTTASFVIWVFSLGGDHVGALSWYEPYQGSVVLILWTLAVPILFGERVGDFRLGRNQTAQTRKKTARKGSRAVAGSPGPDPGISGTA